MSPQRLIVLKTADSQRFLPIWIGTFEADAIAMELQGLEAPRPMSHDLLKEAITALGGTVAYVVIHQLQQDTFFARVVLEQNGREVTLDSRPSDSIALAVRMKAPIFVESAVVERAGISREQDMRDVAQAEAKPADDGTLEVFRDFIEELRFDTSGEGTSEDA
jgi:bifunctional DNase/RNase